MKEYPRADSLHEVLGALFKCLALLDRCVRGPNISIHQSLSHHHLSGDNWLQQFFLYQPSDSLSHPISFELPSVPKGLRVGWMTQRSLQELSHPLVRLPFHQRLRKLSSHFRCMWQRLPEKCRSLMWFHSQLKTRGSRPYAREFEKTNPLSNLM